MVERLTTSGAGVEVVVGKAGAGKTLGPRRGPDGLGRRAASRCSAPRCRPGRPGDCATGPASSSDTLARVLAGVESGRSASGPADVVVVDEAGMVGTRALAALVDAAEAAGAKLVLVGDPRQLPEIEAGGALAALVERVGAIELTENRRQHEPWERLALDALRLGRAEVALATYERAGRVHSRADHGRGAAASWSSAGPSRYRAGHDAVMLAVGRAEVAASTRPPAPALRRSGRLGADVLEVDGLGFAVGDKVICLRNDRRIGVVNGTIGTVERARRQRSRRSRRPTATASVAQRLPRGRPLGHAYALTVHKAQGLTVERAFVLASESLTQEAGYVAMSRAREVTELFVPLEPAADDAGHDPRRVEVPRPAR